MTKIKWLTRKHCIVIMAKSCIMYIELAYTKTYLYHQPAVVKLLWYMFKPFQALQRGEVSCSGSLGIHHTFDGATVTVGRQSDEFIVNQPWDVLIQPGQNLDNAGR